ncbi:ketopantoate reductase family protein [Brevibacillus centrosporus]|uniref:ketopantoate reductase family protein n=1 Tax=Brevibacillus centrosporus TaxID=54910 RepID=UPI003800EA5B
MKIGILGSGALGSAIGGVLTEAGSEVYLIRRSTEHVNVMNSKGLMLKEGNHERIVRVRAETDCTNIGHVDLVIVLVKSYHTKEAIENARPMIGEHTMVMSLQNGLGNEEIIGEVVGWQRVLVGRTYVGGVMLESGQVIVGAKGKHTYIGEQDGQITDRVNRVAEVFNRAGLSTTVSSNIMGIMWDKLLINVATGALCGITRLPYGGLYNVPEVKDCALAAVAEGIAVAKACGVVLSIQLPEEAWFRAAEGLPDNFKPSMLQSIENGMRTEIDFINGSVVRWGAKRNVPTPVNKVLVACVKGIEYEMGLGTP